MRIHSSQKLFKKIIKKTREARSVSPIIAIVLLIGLTVIAMAILALLVFTFLQGNAQIEFVSSSLSYDLEETKTQGRGMGLFKVTLSNSGQETAEIVGFKVQYQVVGGTENFQDLNEPITTLEGVTSSDPYSLEPATQKTFNVIFPLVDQNADNEVRYRITYLLKDGSQGTFDKDKSYGSIGADRPTITYADLENGTLLNTPSKMLRRTAALQPTVSDPVGGEWKEVIYTLTNASGVVRQWSITPSVNPNGYLTNWNTRLGTSLGVANGTYSLNITVIDWAGLSASISGNVTVDNDYVKPTIQTPPLHYYEFPNGTKRSQGEVGNSMIVEVNVTDSGSFDSAVQTVLLWYRVNTTGYDWNSVSLSKVGGTLNTYRGNIPSADVNSDAMDHKIAYFIQAFDKDGNVAYTNATASSLYQITVIDTTAPDISFTPSPLTAESGSEFYITATITDKDQVNDTTVVLYWRWFEDDESTQGKPYANDTNINTLPQSPIDSTPTDLSDWNILPVTNQSGSQYSWLLDNSIVKLYGIAYFIEAKDRSGNVARDGSPSSPNTIITFDTNSPFAASIYQLNTSVSGVVTAGNSLEVIAMVSDDDPTFSIMGSGFTATGNVVLEYRDLPDSTWTKIPMTLHPTMNQPDGGNTTGYAFWYATIPSSAFDPNDGDKDFQLKVTATDQSGNPPTTSNTETLVVVKPGTPVLQYVDGSAKASNPQNSTLIFTINNTAPTPAPATIVNMTFTIRNVSGHATGTPIATQINASSTTILWQNGSALGGINGTKISLNSTLSLSAGNTVEFRVRFVSTDSNYFNLTGYKINVTIFYTYQDGSTTVPDSASFIIEDLIFPSPASLPFIEDFESYTPGTYPSATWKRGDNNAPIWTILDVGSISNNHSFQISGVDTNVLTYSYIKTTTFELPFEVVFQFYLDGNEENLGRWLLIFDSNVSDGDFYYAGWLGDTTAGNGKKKHEEVVIGQYSSGGGWNDLVMTTDVFEYKRKTVRAMKVVIDSSGVVTVFIGAQGGGSWTSGAQTTITGLPSSLQLGLAFYNHRTNLATQIDNFGVYEVGTGPTPLVAQSKMMVNNSDDNSRTTTNSQPHQYGNVAIEAATLDVIDMSPTYLANDNRLYPMISTIPFIALIPITITLVSRKD